MMHGDIPGITFDRDGICNFCHLQDKMDRDYPLDHKGAYRLQQLIGRIKSRGRGKPFDCIVGISGGRDSMYTLYQVVKTYDLRPLAVQFDDGFTNPVAEENIRQAVAALDVPVEKVTASHSESIDLKRAFLAASVPDLDESTDIGIAAALYGKACQHHLSYILVGQSFRTEGIGPLGWYYIDGKYLKAVHRKYGEHPLKPWKPETPGYHLDLGQMIYYTIRKGIRTIPILYYEDYNREQADTLLSAALNWKHPGAHYGDDHYQSLVAYVLRSKFGIDRRVFNYSALIRSGQLSRERALEKLSGLPDLEQKEIIDKCLDQLDITPGAFEKIMASPPRSFRDFSTNYPLMKQMKWLIYAATRLNILPSSTYDKYFNT